jgi:hypothetical protein
MVTLAYLEGFGTGLLMFLFSIVYIAVVVFSLVMLYRGVRALERIAGAQERRMDGGGRIAQ